MISSKVPIKLGPWAQVRNSILRIAGRDLPVGQQIAQWGRSQTSPQQAESLDIQATAQDIDDPGLILPRLRVRRPEQPQAVAPPGKHPSFAQLNEEQRWVYLDWLKQRGRSPDIGYAYLYLYGLEAGLFDRRATACCLEVQWLFSQVEEPVFQAQATFDVALGAWLLEKADLFTWAIERVAWSSPYAGALLWMQAALDLPLTPQQLVVLSPACGYTPQSGNSDLLDDYVGIGLKAFEENTGISLLKHFVERLTGGQEGGEKELPVEIRLANPAARFTLQIVDTLAHPPFRQAVSELVALADREAEVAQERQETRFLEETGFLQDRREWYVVLEFGESSSEYFGKALAMARKQAGYSRLLDEKRNLVHRVIFRRRDVRRFWQLLDLVRQWKSTRVYVNGEERQPSQLWPYMQL